MLPFCQLRLFSGRFLNGVIQGNAGPFLVDLVRFPAGAAAQREGVSVKEQGGDRRNIRRVVFAGQHQVFSQSALCSGKQGSGFSRGFRKLERVSQETVL